MPTFKLLALTLLIAAGTASAVHAQYGATRTRLPAEESLEQIGLTRAWWGQATTNSSRDKLIHITVDETSLYTQSSSGVITAFNNETGKRLWAAQIGGSDRAIYPATSNDEFLFVVNGMTLFAVKKYSGNIQWELRMPGQPASSPVADERNLYLGFLDGSVYAFDLKTVASLKSRGLLPKYSFEAVLWRYKTSKPVTAPPVPVGANVAFASQNGSLYSVKAANRKLVFQFETDATLSAPMVRYKDWLLLASEDFNFYQINLQNGRTGWQFSAGVAITQAPVVVGDEIFLMPNRGGMFKIAGKTGEQVWWRPRAETLVCVTPTRVYATDATNNLVVMSREDGAPIASMPMERFTQHVVNDRSDRIYLATPSGLVVCFREIGRDFPVFHLHPERAPIMPEFAPEVAEPEDASAAEMKPDAEKPETETEGTEKSADEKKSDEKPKDE